MFDLKLIEDERVLHNRLSTAKLKKFDVILWRFIGEKKITVNATIEMVRRDKREISIVPQLGEDLRFLDLMTGQTQIDIYIPELVMIFRSTLKSAQRPKRYIFSLPDKAYMSERRKGARIRVNQREDLKFRYVSGATSEKLAMFKSCEDISERGFSYIVSKTEAKSIEAKSNNIHGYEFQIDNKKFQGNLKILKVQEIFRDEKDYGYGQFKVSCFFETMSPEFKKELQYFIFLRLKADLDVINGM